MLIPKLILKLIRILRYKIVKKPKKNQSLIKKKNRCQLYLILRKIKKRKKFKKKNRNKKKHYKNKKLSQKYHNKV
jgi:hypothetical protein